MIRRRYQNYKNWGFEAASKKKFTAALCILCEMTDVVYHSLNRIFVMAVAELNDVHHPKILDSLFQEYGLNSITRSSIISFLK